VSTVIDGRGTAESVWVPWLEDRTWPTWEAEPWRGARVVVLAAHPDDEVLGAAALLQALAGVDASLCLAWATDGEASHPGSTAVRSDTLRRRRRAESTEALRRLGVRPMQVLHLGLPDSGLQQHAGELRDAVRRQLRGADLVVAPWRGDGHPDHEAVGAAAAALGVPLLEYPIWMWHWAMPADGSVPWSRARVTPVRDPGAKLAAIDAFETQVRPLGPEPADAAVLPPYVVERFLRPVEVVFA
jgi:LmbE family N-acetylglucosaminyl deacetylase